MKPGWPDAGSGLLPHRSRQLVRHVAVHAATIAHASFQDLDAPVERLGGLDTPIPFSKHLEEVYSAKGRLVPALRKLLGW